MTSEGEALTAFQEIFGRELVSKPAISLNQSWSGYRRSTHEAYSLGLYMNMFVYICVV